MRLIQDMLPTARKAEQLEDEMRQARATLGTLRRQYEKLKAGTEEE